MLKTLDIPRASRSRVESWVIRNGRRIGPPASYVARVLAVNFVGACVLALFTYVVGTATSPPTDGAAGTGLWSLFAHPLAARAFLLLTAIGWMGSVVMSLPLLVRRRVGATGLFVLLVCFGGVLASTYFARPNPLIAAFASYPIGLVLSLFVPQLGATARTNPAR